MCELSELSSMHTLSSTTTLPSKTSLKTHRANLNVIEAENISSPRRANDTSSEECQATGIHLVSSSSPYSSPNVLGHQPLNLLSNNSASDPLLSTSVLSSMTSNVHRVNSSSVAESEAAQRCTNDASPRECQAANSVHSPSSFYLSPLNLSSDSSISSSDVSIVFIFFIFLVLFFLPILLRIYCHYIIIGIK